MSHLIHELFLKKIARDEFEPNGFSITFNRVRFGYTDETVINDLNLKINSRRARAFKRTLRMRKKYTGSSAGTVV